MIHLITYATENMMRSAQLCTNSAIKNGVNEYHLFSNDSYPEWNSFNIFNKDILSQERGAGYWLWKPYFILLTLHYLKDGDILIYSDAGVEFINNVNHIIEKMDEDIFFFGNNWNHVDWCKMDVINGIGLTPSKLHQKEYLTEIITKGNKVSWVNYENPVKQVQASVIFFKVNDNTRRFVKEWLLWCQMPDFIDDSPSKLPNYHTFQEGRHDQSVLTCLQIKYNFKIHWWPAQYSDGAFVYDKIEQYQSDNYPVIFHHHRRRNEDWK